jgi:hypothetical protein
MDDLSQNGVTWEQEEEEEEENRVNVEFGWISMYF